MTVNSRSNPNRVHVSGDVVFGTFFGPVCSVVPISIQGNGHQPHVHIGFRSGLSLELTPETAAELTRRIPEALASLAHLPDVSGSAWNGGE